MPSWRISKYNPVYRAENGAFLKDDWTSISDIGQEFDGLILTYESYRKIEDAYVSTAVKFISEAGIKALKVKDLEGPYFLKERADELKSITYDPKLVREGMKVRGKVLEEICRLCLREFMWCRLKAENGFHLHFGYDYYMYIGGDAPFVEALLYTEKVGLFAEEMVSPYLSKGL